MLAVMSSIVNFELKAKEEPKEIAVSSEDESLLDKSITFCFLLIANVSLICDKDSLLNFSL